MLNSEDTMNCSLCSNHCSQGVLVVAASFLILFFNIEIPNELKGFVFYAQVQAHTFNMRFTCTMQLTSENFII